MMKLTLSFWMLLSSFSALSFAQIPNQDCSVSCSESCRQQTLFFRDQVNRYVSQCGDPEAASNPQYVCSPSQANPGKFYFNRVTDNTKLGGYFDSFSECRDALYSMRGNYTCAMSEANAGKSYLLAIATNEKKGGYYADLRSCVSAIQRLRGTLICSASEANPGQAYLLNLSNGQQVGNYYQNLNDCLNSI